MSRVLNAQEMAVPGSKEHAQTVTASKIPTILGLNPWQTASELWMVMAGLAEPEHLEGDHLDWGHDAEDSLVAWWRRHHPGWKTGKGEVAYTDESLPFMNQATLDRRATRGRAHWIIECKTSNSKQTWESEVELPGHIYPQVLAQMGISGIHRATVVAQVGSTVPCLYSVKWDSALWEGVVEQVAAFVDTLGRAEPPQPPADLMEALQAPAPKAEVEVVDLSLDQVAEYRRLTLEKEKIEAALKAEKAALEEAARGKKVTVEGKAFMTPIAGRFSKSNVPAEARHLLSDPDVLSLQLDRKKLEKKYPDVIALGTGKPSYRYGKVA